MLHDVTRVTPLHEYRLRLTFDDGVEGEVDLRQLIDFVGVFEPLRDIEEFRKVRVDPEIGTICWPNGADLDPIVLYAAATGRSVEDVLASTTVR